MGRNNCKPDPCECKCKQDKCKLYASDMIYDCESIPEICVRNGDSLCTVLESIGKVLTGIMNKSSQVNSETFEGFTADNYVELKYKPDEILLVFYGGGILPPSMYKTSGKRVIFSDAFCRCTDFDSITVVYRSAYANDFNSPCFGY